MCQHAPVLRCVSVLVLYQYGMAWYDRNGLICTANPKKGKINMHCYLNHYCIHLNLIIFGGEILVLFACQLY